MTATKLTVTEGLVKLKLTQKKIADAQGRLHCGTVGTKGSRTVVAGFKDNEEYKREIKSRLDTVNGLLLYRDSLKRAIITSNANTKVKIGSREMTVAEAIEFKQSINIKKSLFELLNKNLNTLNAQLNQANANLDARADAFVTQLFNGNANATEEDRKKARENWIENNRAVAITHDSLKDTVEKLGEEIVEFEGSVNVSLSVCNAKTEIEVVA